MDYGLLLIFFFGGCWLYAAAMLAFFDWRWNIGRALLYAAAGGYSAMLLLTHRTGAPWTAAVGALFLLTVVLPLLAQWASRRMLGRDRVAAARWLDGLAALLTGRSSAQVFPALARLHALMVEEGPSAFAAERQGRWFFRMQTAIARRGFLESWIEALAALHHHAEAIRLYEENFQTPPAPNAARPSATNLRRKLRPTTNLLYVMAVPYSDTGEFLKATACLQRAEASRDAGGLLDLRRFIAYIHLYAQSGRFYALERLLDLNAPMARALPTAYLRLWRGVALLRHGEREPGLEMLQSALRRCQPGEERIRRIIERYLARPPAEAGPLPITPETALALDAVEPLEDRPPAAEPVAPASAPVATFGFIIACTAVWMLTGLFSPMSAPQNIFALLGGSADTMTLVRFGANVGDMVKAGEWWRLVSSIFLHAGLLHLALNLYACYLFGAFVERLAGRWAVFVVFLFSGITGSMASAFLGRHHLSVGASGAIFGLLGAAIVIALRFHGLPPWMRRVYVFNFLFIAALNFTYGFLEPVVDNLAHGGGFVGGLFAGLWLAPLGSRDWRHSALRAAAPVLACVLAAAVLLTARNVQSGYPERYGKGTVLSGPQGEWRAEMPAFWRVREVATRPTAEGMPMTEMVLLDPLGAELEIIASNRGVEPVNPESGLDLYEPRDGARVAKYRYVESDMVVDDSDPPRVRLVFITRVHARTYTIRFLCDRQHVRAYWPMVNAILTSFEVTRAPGAEAR